MSLPTGLKRFAERGLGVLLGHPRRMAGKALILAYHNIVPSYGAALGDQSLHLPLDTFARQLDILQEHCDIVPLLHLVEAVPPSHRPCVAITFDDAYRGAVVLGLPELRRRGLPSTLFVAPGLLGEPSFWWDELSRDKLGLRPDLRERALTECGGRADLVRKTLLQNNRGVTLPALYGGATSDDITSIAQQSGLTLGAHSWSHPSLGVVDEAQLHFELSQPLLWSRASQIPLAPILAFPYGISDFRVETAAFRAGYTHAFRVEGGWFSTPIRDRMRIPRYNVPAGLTADGLLLRLSGRFLR